MNKVIKQPEWANNLQQTCYYHLSCPECGLNFFIEEYCVDEESHREIPEEDSAFQCYCPMCKRKTTQVASDIAKVWLSIMPIPIEEEEERQ